MSSFKHRQRTFSGNSASSLIRVGNDHPECALAKSRPDEHWFSITRTIECGNSGWSRTKICTSLFAEPRCDFAPECLSCGSVVTVIAFSLNDVEPEIRRNRNPIRFV